MDQERAEAPSGRDQLVAVLYHRERAGLVRLAYGLTGDRSDAEEIVQDAFAALLRRWGALREVDAAPGYLYTAVVNGARARYRQRKIRERLGVLIGPSSSAAQPDVAEEAAVLAAIRQLAPRKRACVLLRYYADLSEVETATVLGVSVGTVKSQTAKALTRLAVLLTPQQSEVSR